MTIAEAKGLRRDNCIKTGLFITVGALAFASSAQNVDRLPDAAARTPDLPIVVIVPFPPGGTSNRIAVIVAAALGDALKRTVTTRNIPTGTGVDALREVRRISADEIRVGYATSTQVIQGTILSRPAAYSPSDDFDWIGIIGTFGNALVVGPQETTADFDAWVANLRTRGRPIRLGAGARSSMSMLAAQFLAEKLGLPVEFSSYAAADAAYPLLAEGKLDAYLDGVPNALEEVPRIKGRIIAVTSRERTPVLPGIPAFGERWPGEDFSVFAALVVSRKETEAIRGRLKSGWYGVNRTGNGRVELQKIGINYLGLGLEQAPLFMEDELLRHAKLLARFDRAP
jgi:tripartite-type tricarboxylate transporter receptor subunit TctC